MSDTTHVAMPVSLYTKLIQFLMTLPYNQVKPVIEELEREAIGANINDQLKDKEVKPDGR